MKETVNFYRHKLTSAVKPRKIPEAPETKEDSTLPAVRLMSISYAVIKNILTGVHHG
jgi:hypothetical protein